MNTYELRWRDGTVERITCRFVDVKTDVLHFMQNHQDGPVHVLTVSNAEIHSIRLVSHTDLSGVSS